MLSAQKPAKRTRNAALTKSQILMAAARAFSRRGYAEVTLNDIAGEVGINAALIVRYFGSKQELYRQALHAQTPQLSKEQRANFARFMTVEMFRPRVNDFDPLRTMVMSLSSAEARAMHEAYVFKDVLEPFARELGGPSAEIRAGLILAVIGGLSMFKDILGVPALNEGDQAETRAWFSSTLQGLIDGTGFADPT